MLIPKRPRGRTKGWGKPADKLFSERIPQVRLTSDILRWLEGEASTRGDKCTVQDVVREIIAKGKPETLSRADSNMLTACLPQTRCTKQMLGWLKNEIALATEEYRIPDFVRDLIVHAKINQQD